MDAPFLHPQDAKWCRYRGPLRAWVPIAIIVAVLAGAGFAASSVPDTRDFAQKHATVIQEHIL